VTPRILPAFITSGLIILVASSIVILCINELYSKRQDPSDNNKLKAAYTSWPARALRHFLRYVSNYLLCVYFITACIFLVRELPRILGGNTAQPAFLSTITDAHFDAFVIFMFAISIVLVTVILRWYIFVRKREA
jgi:hypothetical protein